MSLFYLHMIGEMCAIGILSFIISGMVTSLLGNHFFNGKENGFIVIFLNLFLLTYTSLECNLQFAHTDILFYVLQMKRYSYVTT